MARAKKITPLLANGEITYDDEHKTTMRYVLNKELYYRCSRHERTDGTIERYVFPTLEANQKGPFPFDVYIDGKKRYPNTWTTDTKIQVFNHFCKHIEGKCKKFGLHFASKMH